MKKSILAGAASLAVAAMPVMGVFAADTTTQTDTLSITIDASCTMQSVSHTDGEGAWSENTLSETMTAGSFTTNLGKTNFNIFCNSTAGWTVTASAAANLSSGTDNIPFASSTLTAASPSGYTVTSAGTGVDSTGIMTTAASQIIAQQNQETVNAGTNFDVTYGVAVADGTPAGTYTGTVIYTLAAL